MFVSTLTSVVELDRIEEALPDHVAWLDRQYADGVTLLSGRQNPRVGGVILWRSGARAGVEARIAADPFVARGLATVAIVEFRPTKAAPGLESLIE
ncbi:MAG: YciI family protein [Thermomicrobiales bacterium]